MGHEEIQERQKSLAAPFIFLIVVAFQLAYYYLDHLKKSGFDDDEKEIQLRGEIKHLLKEASLLSQPSTFAQAAKLKRLAITKERELTKLCKDSCCACASNVDPMYIWYLIAFLIYQSSQHKGLFLYLKMVLIAKYLTYGMLLIWFWRVPVASISQQLVQPFGRLLSWKTGAHQSNNVAVGIIAWLVVSARVCRFVRRACSKYSRF